MEAEVADPEGEQAALVLREGLYWAALGVAGHWEGSASDGWEEPTLPHCWCALEGWGRTAEHRCSLTRSAAA